MKIYNPTLIKTGSQEQIQYWESPKPQPDDYIIEAESNLYNHDLDVWRVLVKTLDVHPSAVEEIEDLLFSKEGINPHNEHEIVMFYDKLKTGIPLSGIEDRLEIKEYCGKQGLCSCFDCESVKQYFILKPIPSKEEETHFENLREHNTKASYDDAVLTIASMQNQINELQDAIQSALRIRDLWGYNKTDKVSEEHIGEYEAIATMENTFKRLVQPVCEHKNIDMSDGLTECLDCGTRNY